MEVPHLLPKKRLLDCSVPCSSHTGIVRPGPSLFVKHNPGEYHYSHSGYDWLEIPGTVRGTCWPWDVTSCVSVLSRQESHGLSSLVIANNCQPFHVFLWMWLAECEGSERVPRAHSSLCNSVYLSHIEFWWNTRIHFLKIQVLGGG